MAKRFTDTGKWDKQSFADLPVKLKLVWVYLCDRCDHAGVWDINMSLLSFQTGIKMSIEELASGFGVWVEVRGTKLLLTNFIEFQYGTLNPDNRVHQSVLSRLEKLAPSKDLTSPLHGAKDKEKEKDKDKIKEEEEEFFNFWNSQNWDLPKVSKLNADRKTKIRARLKEAPLSVWKEAMVAIYGSDFLLGKKTSWRADFDWLIANETNRLKIIEGKYQNTSGSSKDWDVMTIPLPRRGA